DYIAAKYHEFRDYMQAKRAQESLRSQFMSYYLDHLQEINALDRTARANIARLAEVPGSMQVTPEALPDGTIRVKVPDYTATHEKGKLNSALMLSKPGDVATL